MSARDFINETLLPKLERELADESKGNKHYLAAFEGALKAMTRLIESHQRPVSRRILTCQRATRDGWNHPNGRLSMRSLETRQVLLGSPKRDQLPIHDLPLVVAENGCGLHKFE